MSAFTSMTTASGFPSTTVPVVNTQKSTVSLIHSGPQGREEYIWAPTGSLTGDDLKEVPSYVTENPNFKRQLRRKILRVISPEELAQRQGYETDDWVASQQREEMALLGKMDHSTQDYFVEASCMAPNETGRPCGIKISVRYSQRYEHPPLCDAHAYLAQRCVLVQDQNMNAAPGENLVWLFQNAQAPR